MCSEEDERGKENAADFSTVLLKSLILGCMLCEKIACIFFRRLQNFMDRVAVNITFMQCITAKNHRN